MKSSPPDLNRTAKDRPRPETRNDKRYEGAFFGDSTSAASHSQQSIATSPLIAIGQWAMGSRSRRRAATVAAHSHGAALPHVRTWLGGDGDWGWDWHRDWHCDRGSLPTICGKGAPARQAECQKLKEKEEEDKDEEKGGNSHKLTKWGKVQVVRCRLFTCI